MRRGTIVSRLVTVTIAVSVLSAVTLAAVTTLTARVLWQDHLRRHLDETAGSVAALIDHELEEGIPIGRAAPYAIREAATAGYRLEVWKDSALLAQSATGRLLGPMSVDGEPGVTGERLVTTRRLAGGVTVIAAVSPEQGLPEVQLFRRSLLYSLPFCLVLAIVIGRFVGLRAARPLREFTDEVEKIRELRTPDLPDFSSAPSEVRNLERSFRDLLTRLGQSLSRELEFAGNASHELRTPLTRIRLHAERALADAGPTGKVELGEQLREIDQLVRLVEALLVLARDVESGIPIGEGVNLADLVRDRASHVFAGGMASQIEAPDEVMVRGDENLLSIAVENLMDNAKKYTPAGSRPSVVVSQGAEGVQVALFSPGADLPRKGRDWIFERFVRGGEARAAQEGHGLGLSLARHIAELHKGTLSCRQEVRGGVEGALFLLALPRWAPDSAQRDVA